MYSSQSLSWINFKLSCEPVWFKQLKSLFADISNSEVGDCSRRFDVAILIDCTLSFCTQTLSLDQYEKPIQEAVAIQ
jgi:hypothetical protein